MRVTGGAAEEMPEGPLEKRMESIEKKAEEGKGRLSRRIDRMANRVDQTGDNLANKTSNWERNVFHSISDSIRSGSDYIQGMNVNRQFERLTMSVRKNPTKTLLVALGVGLLLGYVVRRR